ncbi:Bromodomain and WD repeat-containing protein 1 [Coemansia sp. RSA 1365]|nr:Bromodomain and WD repeat-containing protein 1 [Coemansia sp. RSA 1365]
MYSDAHPALATPAPTRAAQVCLMSSEFNWRLDLTKFAALVQRVFWCLFLRVELNFLIAHYLSQGPLREAAGPLRQELEERADAMLPQRYDWLGNLHSRAYDELAQEHPHITPDELLRIMQALISGDSLALLTAGGTVLGRTHRRPYNTTSKALTTS